MGKKLIRTRLLALREAESPVTKARRDRKIISRLMRFAPFIRARTIFSYITHRGEADTIALFEHSIGRKKILVPKIAGGKICLYELLDHKNFTHGASF